MNAASESVSITIRHLEMQDRSELRPKRTNTDAFLVRQVVHACPEFNRFLYCAVGWPWFWVDKLSWTYEQWQAYVERPELETWVGYLDGSPAGYFELEQQPERQVEIVYFGLLPGFTGRGLGGQLLTVAVERAWELGAARVWLHTCTLDHPAALNNYLARGFRPYREETVTKSIPSRPHRGWP